MASTAQKKAATQARLDAANRLREANDALAAARADHSAALEASLSAPGADADAKVATAKAASAAAQTRVSTLATIHQNAAEAEAEIVAALDAEVADLARKPGTLSGPIVAHDNREDAPFASLGEQMIAVAMAAGPDPIIDPRLRRSAGPSGANTNVPSEGGFLVQTDLATPLVERAYNVGEISRRVFRLPISENSDGTKINVIDETSRAIGSQFGGVVAYWLGQGDQKIPSKPKFRQIELGLKKIAALFYATDESLRDAVQLAAIANRVVPVALNFQVEQSFFSGTGVGQPLGFINSGAAITVTPETDQGVTILWENIKKMWARLSMGSRSSAIWTIGQDSEAELYGLHQVIGTGGVPVYLPPSGAASSPLATLMGRPVVVTEYNSALGTVGDIALIDFGQYVAIDKGGVEQASSIHVRFIYDETVFRWVYRVDGYPMWNAPVTPANGGPTVSPIVLLGTRT